MLLIFRSDFEERFGAINEFIESPDQNIKVIWRNRNIEDILVGTKKELKDREWLLTKSVFQGVNPLNKAITEVSEDGIELWAIEKTINDSWCYGLSPDVPWVFSNNRDVEIWFKHYDKLKSLIKGFVKPHYWNSIDYMRLRF